MDYIIAGIPHDIGFHARYSFRSPQTRGGGQVSRFKVGDVVTLVSGGGPMTVVAVNGDLVTCCWFESLPEGGWKGVNRATFPEAVLQEVTGDEPQLQRPN